MEMLMGRQHGDRLLFVQTYTFLLTKPERTTLHTLTYNLIMGR